MHRTTIKVLFTAICLSLALRTYAVELSSTHPDRYTVKRGDTLWDIAGVFLEKPWQWPEIWHKNESIKDPHWIYPGNVLVLTYRDGQPVLEFAGAAGQGRDLKLSPRINEVAHDLRIPPIPLDAIWPFLSRPRVIGPTELALAPYIITSQDEHLISGPGTHVYVRGLTGSEPQRRYSVLRCGEVYRRLSVAQDSAVRGSSRPGLSQAYETTCTGESTSTDVLGYEAVDVGDAEIIRSGDPATGVIVRAQREVLAGDRLVPQTELAYPEFIPHAPTVPTESRVISVLGSLVQVGPYQVVALDRGEDANLEPGHVLAIHQSGIVTFDRIGARVEEGRTGRIPVSNNIELPNEHIGELMVFRVFAHVSYGLVMRTSRPVHIGDAVRNPE